MQLTKKLFCFLFLYLSASSAALAQVDVAYVKPAETRAAVTELGYTLLLLNSHDPGCGYCKGQEQIFTELARSYTKPLRMRQVSWSPWHQLPEQKHFPKKISGVPMWQLFHDGQFVAEFKGRMAHSLQLRFFLEQAILDHKFWQKAAQQQKKLPAFPDDYQLNDFDRAAVNQMWRRNTVKNAFVACTRLYPEDVSKYRQVITKYDRQHAKKLLHGRIILQTLSNSNAKPQIEALVPAFRKEMEQPQSIIKNPTTEGCSNIIDKVIP